MRLCAVVLLTLFIAAGCERTPAPHHQSIPTLDEAHAQYQTQQRVLWLTTYARQRQIDGARYAAAVRSATVSKTVRDRARPSAPVSGSGIWDKLAACESSGNWSAATGNGFYGGLQYTLSTWRAYGGVGMPNHASREAQIAVAERVLAGQGWGAWPACSRKLGLR